MRGVSPRVPYEKLACSQPIRVRTKQVNLAQQIGKEEDLFLDDLNQFYLDYHNYEQKKSYFLQLKHVQSIINQEKMIKSTFSNIFLDQLNQRKNYALKILNDPIVDNSELEKDVVTLESKVVKYQKALKQRSSIQYLYGDLYPKKCINFTSNENKENVNSSLNERSSPKLSNGNNNENTNYASIESKVLEVQLQNEEKQMELRRKNIVLNQKLKAIDNEIYQVQKSLLLYKSKRYESKFRNHDESKGKNGPDYIYEVQETIIKQQKHYLQEKNNELFKIKEQISINEKQNQADYDELEQKFIKLTEEMKAIEQLEKELYQINENISLSKSQLLSKKNECYDAKRKFKLQNNETQNMKQYINNLKASIADKQAILAEKEGEIDLKRKEIDKNRQEAIAKENELSTMKKLLELKQKNIHFIQNRIDSLMKGTKSNKNTVKRLLNISNLKKPLALSSKPFAIRKNENIIQNQF